MSGDQEPWVFRGGLTADLQVQIQKKIDSKYYQTKNNSIYFIIIKYFYFFLRKYLSN